jgi:magnesium chelatase family protein
MTARGQIGTAPLDFLTRFQLVAAMNPCPCGYLGDENGLCHCSAEQVSRYRGRISGPLLDRIDLHLEVSRPREFPLQHDGPAPESSASVRARVLAARDIQDQRAGKTNAQLDGLVLKQFCRISAADRKLLLQASKQHALSPRACIRILKVARTLADLECAADINTAHVAEAISYRNCRAMRAFQVTLLSLRACRNTSITSPSWSTACHKSKRTTDLRPIIIQQR